MVTKNQSKKADNSEEPNGHDNNGTDPVPSIGVTTRSKSPGRVSTKPATVSVRRSKAARKKLSENSGNESDDAAVPDVEVPSAQHNGDPSGVSDQHEEEPSAQPDGAPPGVSGQNGEEPSAQHDGASPGVSGQNGEEPSAQPDGASSGASDQEEEEESDVRYICSSCALKCSLEEQGAYSFYRTPFFHLTENSPFLQWLLLHSLARVFAATTWFLVLLIWPWPTGKFYYGWIHLCIGTMVNIETDDLRYKAHPIYYSGNNQAATKNVQLNCIAKAIKFHNILYYLHAVVVPLLFFLTSVDFRLAITNHHEGPYQAICNIIQWASFGIYVEMVARGLLIAFPLLFQDKPIVSSLDRVLRKFDNRFTIKDVPVATTNG